MARVGNCSFLPTKVRIVIAILNCVFMFAILIAVIVWIATSDSDSQASKVTQFAEISDITSNDQFSTTAIAFLSTQKGKF